MVSPGCTDILMAVREIIASMPYQGGRRYIDYLNQQFNQNQGGHEAIINGKPGKQAQAMFWPTSLPAFSPRLGPVQGQARVGPQGGS